MSRWTPGTVDRLRDAALTLFSEHGYDETTVDDIAAAAGVTQRTFFRHFLDKEEVLFDDDARMQQILVDAVRSHTSETAPLTSSRALALARRSMHLLALDFVANPDEHRRRARVLDRVPALLGRQLLKQERWSEALRTELTDLGATPRDAAIAVELAGSAMRLAYAHWATTEHIDLIAELQRTNADIDAIRESDDGD